jgi:CTP-dependent riboflavin kinase
MATRGPTPEELRLIGREEGAVLPPGGLLITGSVAAGTGTAAQWSTELSRLIGGPLGVAFAPGTLNIQLDHQVQWEAPLRLDHGTHPWELCPIILADRAIGLAFRGNRDRPDLLEIVSPIRLRDALGGIAPGAQVTGRLLPGTEIPN